jgi:MinD superfamily P-loop ATPase
MTHARMQPGEENSGKLVTKVRHKAQELAKEIHAEYIITDGPPGIGCSSIASITGTDAVLLVLEPSISSLHDAKRIIELVKGFKIPAFALMNKYDLHPDLSQQIETFLLKSNVQLLGKIPFEEGMVEAMIEGKSIHEYDPYSRAAHTIASIWEKLCSIPA